MTSERIRVGVVGANAERGWAARSHLPALRALPELDLAAVCTTRAESARLRDRADQVPAPGRHRASIGDRPEAGSLTSGRSTLMPTRVLE